MGQIKAVSIAINSSGSVFIVDKQGRLWLKAQVNGQWSQVELPEQPHEDTEVSFG